MKIEISDIKIGYSELTGEVFAGKLNKNGTKWIEKVNVTSQFLYVQKNLKLRDKELKDITKATNAH